MLLERYGELLINDGISSFGFGSHESQDEIMVGKYNVITIYSHRLEEYRDFYEPHEIERNDNLITAWDTITPETPGYSTRYEYGGKTVFDLLKELEDWHIYLAETREEKLFRKFVSVCFAICFIKYVSELIQVQCAIPRLNP